MSLLECIGEVLSSKGKEAAQAAKKVAEIANLKAQITSVNGEIKKYYAKIGEAYFEEYKDADVICPFEEHVQSIRDAKAVLEQLESKIKELQGGKECQACKSKIDIDSCYCSKCGAKVETEYFDEEDDLGLDEEEDIILTAEIIEDVEEIIEDAAETIEDTAEDIVEELEEIIE